MRWEIGPRKPRPKSLGRGFGRRFGPSDYLVVMIAGAELTVPK